MLRNFIRNNNKTLSRNKPQSCLRKLFSDQNSNNELDKLRGIEESNNFESYMEEPKRVGISYEQYVKNQAELE